MKVGITGLPGSGKSTVFGALTQMSLHAEGRDATKPQLGVVKVADSRIDELAKVFNSKKVTYLELTFVDKPGFNVSHLGDTDALVAVLGTFYSDNVLKDAEEIETSFIMRDAEVIQHRLPQMEKEIRGGKGEEKKEFDVLKKCRETLSRDAALRTASLTNEERKLVSGYQFLSLKPLLFVSNLAETALDAGSPQSLLDYAGKKQVPVVEFCGKTERDILEIPEAERADFLKEMGIDLSAREKFVKAAFDLLHLISFFTVKGPEARVWTVPDGTPAIEAAGKIHTDMKKGFIRAEVIGYQDLMQCGGKIAEARSKGLLRLEGKDYIVEDGDILDIRFNV